MNIMKKILYILCIILNLIISLSAMILLLCFAWPILLFIGVLCLFIFPIMYIEKYESEQKEKEKQNKLHELYCKYKAGEIDDDEYDYEIENL